METQKLIVDAAELHELQEAIKKREVDLKRERAKLDAMGLAGAVESIDQALKTIKGEGPTRPGLRAKLHIEDEKKDETQLEHELGGDDEGSDYRTWELTVPGVSELCAQISSSEDPPVKKIARLNRLEAGEKERPAGERDGALRAIRVTRRAIVDGMPQKAGPALVG